MSSAGRNGATGRAVRADAAANRDRVADAARRLLAAAGDPAAVTMDAIASAAGVGKGTVFRRFGDRRGLLRTLLAERIADLQSTIEGGPPPLGPGGAPRARVLAVLDAVLRFKIDNDALLRAAEAEEDRMPGASFFDSPSYRWTYELLTDSLEQLGNGDAVATAHALLALTRADYLRTLRAAHGPVPVHDRVRAQMLRLLA